MPSPIARLFHPLVLIALLVLCVAYAFGQKLPLRTYRTADGLATSVIHSTMRDSDGFLWFVGRGGMSRFDGRDFVSFKLADQSAPLVHQVIESRDRLRFWIATDSGLYRVEKSMATSATPTDEKMPGQTRILHATKVSNMSFWAMFEQPDGSLLAGSDSVMESGNTSGDTVEFQNVGLRDGVSARLRVRDIIEDRGGSVWIATDQGIYRRLPNRRWVLYGVPKVYGIGNESGRMALDRDGNIWMPARSGVFVLRPDPPETLADLPDQHEIAPPTTEQKLGSSGNIRLPGLPGEMVRLVPSFFSTESGAGSAVYGSARSILCASDGRIWFSTQDAVYIFDSENYTSLRDADLRPGVAGGTLQDLAGDVWFGAENGVVKLVSGGMISYDHRSGLIEPNVHAIQEMPDGRLIVGHGTWRVSELTDAGFATTRLNLEPNARLGWTSVPVVADKRGSLWVMEHFGLYEFKSRPRLPEQAAQKPVKHDDRSPYRAFNDKSGRIWITGNSDLTPVPLKSYDPETGTWTDYSGLEGYPVKRAIASFAEDSLGRIWMGLYGGGVVILADNKFKALSTEDGIPGGSIFGLVIDHGGRLWISSTEDGIKRVDNPLAGKLEFKSFTEADGLSSNNVRSLAEDNEGNIYAGTVRGVSRIDAKTDEIHVFTTADGLAADFVQAAYRDRNGVMWFGTSNGLSKYQPNTPAATVAREVFIGGLQVAGNDYRLSEFGQRAVEGLDLSSSENNINISYTSVGDATKFQYKLEGSTEQDWTAPTFERTLNFANLSPGSYRLLVRTAGAELQPAVVAFTIRPPFWRSWWFLTLAFLFVAGSVLALDRYRVAKTRQVTSSLAKSVESEARFRTLAETASDAIITIDADSTIVYANEAVERVFGYTAGEVIGTKLTSLMPDRMRGSHEEGLGRYIRTRSKRIAWSGATLPGLHKDGHEIPLELSFGEFERDGERFFTGIARDITERLRAEEEIRKEREERLRELQRVRSRIATDLHDDIGSSLTQIAVLSEVARGHAANINADSVSTPLERIKGVSKELVAVMSDIVWAINPQKDHLGDLVQRMRRFGSDVLSGRGMAFEFNAPDADESLELGANIRREIFAVFKETLNNAAKYSDGSKVVTNFVVSPDALALEIEDDGKGFDPGFVLSDEFRPEMGGNGLVSIRRRVTELGGMCEIRSSVGNGTAIKINVPLGPRHNGDSA